MARETLQTKYRRCLEEVGYTVIQTLSGGRLVMTSGQPKVFYYLGRSGSLRKGRTLTESIPVRLPGC